MKQENTTSEYIKVKKSGIHNAGIFAKKFISNETKIIRYVGEKISKKESDKRADIVLNESKNHKEKGAVYLFELDKKHDLDGNVSYNTARFINHSCDPNCESEIIDGEIWIKAIKDIQRGEELLYNYGYDIDNFDEHPCLCGSHKCKGYIADEEKWDKLKKTLRKKYKNKKVLIAYYSRTGNTEKVAKYLAEYLDFDVDRIKTDNRKGFFGYIKSGYESFKKYKPIIRHEKNPEDYDLVIIGTPIWANTMSSPIITYLEKCKNVDVAAFSTLGGNNPGSVFKNISLTVPSFKGMTHIKSKDIKKNKFQNQVIDFFRKIDL